MSVHERASDTRPEWSAYLLSHRNQRAGIKSKANIYKMEDCRKTNLDTARLSPISLQNRRTGKKEKTRIHHQHLRLGEERPGLHCKYMKNSAHPAKKCIFAYMDSQDMENLYYVTVQDNIKELIHEFTEDYPFGSMAEINSLMGKVTAFSNAIPRWDLKGYSSNEIFQKFEKPKLRPLPKSGFTPYSHNDIVNSFMKMSGGIPKEGRNEPCPCGSGKKYKDCHGKYQS